MAEGDEDMNQPADLRRVIRMDENDNPLPRKYSQVEIEHFRSLGLIVDEDGNILDASVLQEDTLIDDVISLDEDGNPLPRKATAYQLEVWRAAGLNVDDDGNLIEDDDMTLDAEVQKESAPDVVCVDEDGNPVAEPLDQAEIDHLRSLGLRVDEHGNEAP